MQSILLPQIVSARLTKIRSYQHSFSSLPLSLVLLFLSVLLLPVHAFSQAIDARQLAIITADDLNPQFSSTVDILFVYESSVINRLPFEQFDWISRRNEEIASLKDKADVLTFIVTPGYEPGIIDLPARQNEAVAVFVYASHVDPVAEAIDISSENSLILRLGNSGIEILPFSDSAARVIDTTSIAPAAFALDKEALRKAISGPDRDVTDYVRDESRKPVEVLAFLGIEPGMSVLDVYAAGGYYTFILAKAVGPAGRIYAQNTPRGLRFEEDRQDITQGDALDAKIIAGNFTNITPLVSTLDDLDLAPESLDAILVMQVLHDYYNGDPQRALNMLQTLMALLKPGGVVGISDHVGLPGNDNRPLHRMETEQAVKIAEQAGFEVVISDLLRNPDDIHNRDIFDPRLARNTDRFLLKLTKPR